MNDEQFLLASAYLDGEITDEERAIAEADREVMSAVVMLRAQQADLRRVDPVASDVREATITAAMAEFRAVTAAAHTEPARAAIVPFRPRPRSSRYLAIAAAVVAVAALGVVVANGIGGGSDDSSADADTAATVASAERTSDSAGAFLDDTALAPAEAIPSTVPAQAEIAAGDASAMDGADDGAGGSMTAADAPPATLPDEPIGTPAELARVGAALLALEARGELPSTPNTACEVTDILGATRYLFDGVPTEVLVAIVRDDSRVLALAPDTCEVLLDVPMEP
jgi:hypothetical protein